MKILIDGENFRHQIASVLINHQKITDKNDFFIFDIFNFFRDLTGENHNDIIYYTSKISQPTFKIPKQLTTNIDTISTENRKWIAQITNQGAQIIKAGHLMVRESSICVHCGKRTLILQEKGVDVRLATDLVISASQSPAEVALVSSDSDLLPAIQSAKKLNARIVYICYDQQTNRAIVSNASKVITFDDDMVLKHFGNQHHG